MIQYLGPTGIFTSLVHEVFHVVYLNLGIKKSCTFVIQQK